jgi:hypothetical protein
MDNRMDRGGFLSALAVLTAAAGSSRGARAQAAHTRLILLGTADVLVHEAFYPAAVDRLRRLPGSTCSRVTRPSRTAGAWQRQPA